MKTDIRPTRMIVSSEPEMSLVFVTRQELEAYEAEDKALRAKHRAFIREKYGIYAANQGIFVTEESDLNSWDGGY